MSWCRDGGRTVYDANVIREYNQTPPIRGEFIFDDGTRQPFAIGRLYREGDGPVKRRELDHFEVGGVEYRRADGQA